MPQATDEVSAKNSDLRMALEFAGLAIVAATIPLVTFALYFTTTYNWSIQDAVKNVLNDSAFLILNQIDVLLVTIGLLALVIFKLKSETKWILIFGILIAHAFVGWFVICVRGEGGLGGTLF